MGWTLTEPSRKINLAILFLSLFLKFHSGELGASRQGGDAFLAFVYFEMGVSGDPGPSEGREETAAT